MHVKRCIGCIALVSALAGCSDPTATFSHDPIPLELAGAGGGLLGLGTAADRTTLFPMLIDTGSPLSSYADGTNVVRATRGDLRLYSSQFAAGEVERFRLEDVQLFVSQFGGTGLDASNPVGGVLGGDNLHRFVLELSYAPTPSIAITDQLILEECELADRCAASLDFSTGGGRQLIDIGEDIYSYPASYVLLNGCVEPALDPLEPQLICATSAGCGEVEDCVGNVPCEREKRDCKADAERYLPHGIDVRFAVSTGFPGLALTASAFDRLRGRGSAAALFASGTHKLFLPDQAASTAGLGVALDQLGVPAVAVHDAAARAALALVGSASYFGPCAELARSRRLRKVRPQAELDPPLKEGDRQLTCLRSPGRNPEDLLLSTCADQTNDGNVCDDSSEEAHTTGYVELSDPLQVIVVPDTTSLLQNINADVRPQSATVEGVIGTSLLRKLGVRIDYPHGRFVATSADPSTRVFPISGHGADCQPIPLDFGIDEVLAPFHAIPGGGCRLP